MTLRHIYLRTLLVSIASLALVACDRASNTDIITADTLAATEPYWLTKDIVVLPEGYTLSAEWDGSGYSFAMLRLRSPQVIDCLVTTRTEGVEIAEKKTFYFGQDSEAAKILSITGRSLSLLGGNVLQVEGNATYRITATTNGERSENEPTRQP